LLAVWRLMPAAAAASRTRQPWRSTRPQSSRRPCVASLAFGGDIKGCLRGVTAFAALGLLALNQHPRRSGCGRATRSPAESAWCACMGTPTRRGLAAREARSEAARRTL